MQFFEKNIEKNLKNDGTIDTVPKRRLFVPKQKSFKFLEKGNMTHFIYQNNHLKLQKLKRQLKTQWKIFEEA